MLDLTNPFLVIIGGIILLVLVFLWNRSNLQKTRQRRNRSFRDSYYQRKKQREKKDDEKS